MSSLNSKKSLCGGKVAHNKNLRNIFCIGMTEFIKKVKIKLKNSLKIKKVVI
jgi:hypothetical protein